MDRRAFNHGGLGLFAALSALFVSEARAAQRDTASPAASDNTVVISVTTDDRHNQALVLGNARNYAAYYKSKQEPYAVEIVAFGPGYNMLREDISMVKGEIESLQKDLGANLVLSACQNSRKHIAESEGKAPDEIKQLPGVRDTPSGIVRVAELQRQGWSYVRP